MPEETIITGGGEGGDEASRDAAAEAKVSDDKATDKTEEGKVADDKSGDKADDDKSGDDKDADDKSADKKSEDKKDDGDKDGEDEDEKGKAPEKYEDFAVPEGFEIAPEELERFEPLARELDLTQEQAQKLVDFEAERRKEANENAVKYWDDLNKEWVETVEKDKEVGGKNLEQSVAHSAVFLKQFGTPELRAMLKDTGTGNHVEILRVFARAGKAMSEDKVLPGGGGAGEKKSLAERIFPTQSKTS